jgi:DNA-binding NarL/FixJ family response regulator
MKVLVADPQPSVRHALSVWINGQLGWDVVGEASNSFDLLDRLVHLTPEIIIMDRDLPGVSSKELVAEIRQRSKGAAIILLCNCALEQVHADQLDADFFVSKIDPPARMLDIFLKARIWLESRPNAGQDRG